MTFEYFKQIISDMSHIPAEKISKESTFRDDLGVDSLQMVNLLVQISEITSLSFENIIGSDDFSTVGKLYQLIKGGN